MSFEISHACAGKATRIVDRAIAALELDGYSLQSHGSNSAVLYFSAGVQIATRDERQAHHLEITADGYELFFHFWVPGLESARFDKRVLATRAAAVATRARRGPPPPPKPLVGAAADPDAFVCRYCRKLTATADAACRWCGAENFG